VAKQWLACAKDHEQRVEVYFEDYQAGRISLDDLKFRCKLQARPVSDEDIRQAAAEALATALVERNAPQV
jgi:hypothetical protein